MLRRQSVKFYSRLFLLLLIASTAIFYYSCDWNGSLLFKYRFSHKKQIKQVKIKSSIRQHNLTQASNSTQKIVHKKHFEVYDKRIYYSFGNETAEIKLAVVLCGERLNQTIVTLKSAVIFSKRALHFVIIVDDVNKYYVKNELLDWPAYILKRLSFEIHPINFPSGNEGNEWKKLFKLCACQRLFLPSLLHHIDSLLYVDTDVLFMRPIEELWHYFHKMNESQIAALCPEHEDFATGWYNRFARHPFYEPLGVNSGVMLMNLTRMRAFHWEKYLPSIMKEYKLNIVWGDQDIINIIFHFHPDKLYIFPCEWNYRPDHCMYSSVCKKAELNGIAIIHGNRGVFQNNKQPAFKAIYEVMAKFHIGDENLSGLFETIKESLRGHTNTNCGKHLFAIFSTTKDISLPRSHLYR